MSAITVDCEGQSVSSGDRVRILEITPDVELDEDDLEMFMNMVGSNLTCHAMVLLQNRR